MSLRAGCGRSRRRCLECGKEYAKPSGRGTLTTNPGCPDCGYLRLAAEPDADHGQRRRVSAPARIARPLLSSRSG